MKNTFTNKLVNFSFIFVLIVGLISCSEDFFDQEPGNKISPEEHYKNQVEVSNVIDGAYSLLQEASVNMVVINGLLSDMMDVTSEATKDMIELNEHDISLGNAFIDPSIFYKIVVNVNEVFAHIDEVTSTDKDFNEYELFYSKGILCALRSWALFNVTRLYGEAVYFEGNLESFNAQTNFIKLNRTDMIDTLINQVKRYLFDQPEPIEYLNPFTISKKGLLAEMYIEINEYDSAWYYAKEALEEYENKSFKVTKDFSMKQWQNIFIGASNNVTENMSVISFSRDDGQFNLLDDYFNFKYQIKPTSFITNLFESQVNIDGVKGDEYRGNTISYEKAEDRTWIKKYSLEGGNPYSSDNIILRAADLHLIMCEALNRMGEKSATMIFLNQGWRNTSGSKPDGYTKWSGNLGIRGRVNLESVEPPVADYNTVITYIEDKIFDERAMELAFEGKRWFDLVRIARRRNDPSYLANKVSAKFSSPTKANSVKSILQNKSYWYLPKDF